VAAHLRQALDLVREIDAAGLYDSLEPWQRRELLCIVRRIVNEPQVLNRLPPGPGA
jgi:hypothetical protein